MSNIINFTPNGKNRTPDIVKALLHADDNTTINFANGVYDFYAEGAYKGYFFPGCNCNGEKKVIFPIFNVNNLTINGNGAMFLFHDRVFPFIVQNSSEINFINFSVDFSFPRCLEAKVTDMTDEGLTLKILGSNYDVNQFGNLLIKAGGDTFSSSERRFFLEQRDWHCYLAAGDIYYENKNLPAEVIVCSAEKRENEIYFKYKTDSAKAKFTLNKRLMISYDELRENDIFFLERSKDINYSEVHILHGAGMGIVGQSCENLTLNRYFVNPCDEGLYSTTADAILLTNFKGKVLLDNCYIDRSIDDAISIHGFYTVIERITDRNKAVAKLVHPSQAGTNIYFKGDVLKVSDAETLKEYSTLTVKDAYVREKAEYIMLEFEEEVTDKLKIGDYLENNTRTPEVEIKNSTFMNFPAIRLSSAQKTVFENNIVKNCNSLNVNDLMRYWSVSGCVNDLLIKNNVFENIKTAINIFVERYPESGCRHKNILIENNKFINCDTAVKADCVDGLKISNNSFINVNNVTDILNCTKVVTDANI